MYRIHKRRIQQRKKLDNVQHCKHEQENKRLYIYRAIENLNNRMNNHESHIYWFKSVWLPFISALILVVLYHVLFA